MSSMLGNKLTKKNSELGTTLLESLTAIMISSSVLIGTVSLFSSTVKANHDQRIRTESLVHAQAVLQMVGNELKPLGNGVPFDQANFEIGELTLSNPDVSYPIDPASSDSSKIGFRLNESGDISLLTQDFDPISTTTVCVNDVSAYQANDPIYISNSVVGGIDGLYAKVQAVNTGAKCLILDGSTIIQSPTSVFAKGSVLEEVPLIKIVNLPLGAGVSRDAGYGAVNIATDASIAFEYLDSSGNSVALPLSATSIVDSLRAIRLTVVKTHPAKLSTGQIHSVTVSQTFALRNLNILY
jgi:type II secretory pathway pseudopilin PulG